MNMFNIPFLVALNEIGFSEWIMFVVIVLSTVIVAHTVQKILLQKLHQRKKEYFNTSTGFKFAIHLVTALIYVIGLGLAIRSIGALNGLANSLLTGAGLLTVAVGLAAQSALSNIISGIFIVIFKPFKINDRLKIKNEYMGKVEDITLRHTVIRDGENKRIVVPNAVMNNEILINYNFSNQEFIGVVKYKLNIDSDLDQAKALVTKFIGQHSAYKQFLEINENNGDIKIQFPEIDELGIEMKISFPAISYADFHTIASELNETMVKLFQSNKVHFATS